MKILVVHPGTQHSTKLVAALKKSGNEVTLVTTVYNKKGTFINWIQRVISEKDRHKLFARMNLELCDEDVKTICELGGLLLLFLARIDKRKKVYVKYKHYIARKVGKRAAKYAMKNKYEMIISFDSYAFHIFQSLLKAHSQIIKVMDCSAAYAPAAKQTYLKEIERYPDLTQALISDRCVLWHEKYYTEMLEEAVISDYILCASQYTKKTLVDFDIKPEKIMVIPYGYTVDSVDISRVPAKTQAFNILFVGGVNVMKGLPYLIQGLQQIPQKNIRLNLVGHAQDVIINMAKDDERIDIKGYVTHDKLGDIYKQAQLFVFPSLSDGFGYAPLEAMSYGVPCVVTENSGISDIIDNGVDGFVIPSENSDAIKKTIEWCLNNEEKLAQMGERAKVKAKKYSQEKYENEMGKFVSMCKTKMK